MKKTGDMRNDSMRVRPASPTTSADPIMPGRRSLISAAIAGGLTLPWLRSLAATPEEGVTDTEVILGVSAAFSGPSRGLGIELYRGASAYFDDVNYNGGIAGRRISLKIYDDGYQPDACVTNTMKLMLEDRVFLLFGYVGTPTVTRVLPLLKKFQDESVFMFFPFTGAQPQREPPYGDFAFNLRASYLQETAGLVDNFVRIGRRRIAVFYQADAYGRSGWAGVRAALARHGERIAGEATYSRGTQYTATMRRQVEILQAAEPDAVVCIGAYAACAAFARDAVDLGLEVPIANVSFVGSENLLSLLTEGRDPADAERYTRLLVNSQVVPSYEDTSIPAVREYREFMQRYNPGRSGGTRHGSVHAVRPQLRQSRGLSRRQAHGRDPAPARRRTVARGPRACRPDPAGLRPRAQRTGFVRRRPPPGAAAGLLHGGRRRPLRHARRLERETVLMQVIKVQKLFQKTLFGVFALFGFIGISTSILLIYTVDAYLAEEYETNSLGIAQSIADASVDILLNRDLAALQSLIDQFVEIQGISYVYITDEEGEFLAHTFVPGIPDEILSADHADISTVQRQLPGMGDFVEVSRPILAGVAGAVHVGMDTGIIALQVQRAIGRQVYLISIVFVLGVVGAIWLVNLAARPIGDTLTYAVALARGDEEQAAPVESILVRNDEAGQLARLFLHFYRHRAPSAPSTDGTA